MQRALHGDFDSNPIGDFVQGMIPQSLLQAVQWTARVRDRVPSIREDIGASLVTIFTEPELVRAISDAFLAYASDSVREHCQMRVGGRPAAAQIAACSLAFCLSDRHFCAETVVGMMSDYVESSRNWRDKVRTPTSPPLTREFCEEQNEALIDSLNSGGEISDAEAQAYQKTLEECSIHTMAGPWQLSDLSRIYQGFYLLHLRFGVIQNGECRPCDDCKDSGLNQATTLYESLRCISADWPARVAAAFAKLLPDDGSWSLSLATDDVAKAFRQVSTAQPHLSPVALRNPSTGEVEFFTMWGFNFGQAAAPNQFCRVTHWATTTCQHLFGATCGYYYDDIPSLDPSFALGPLETRGDPTFSKESQEEFPYYYHLFGTYKGSTQWCIGLLTFLAGYPLAQKKRKLPAPARKFLGVISDFSQLLLTGVVSMYVDADRKTKLISTISSILAARYASPAAFARLAGKLLFATTWATWRFGRAALQPIFAATSGTFIWAARFALTAAQIGALTFFLSVIPILPSHVIRLFDRGFSSRPRAYVWTDACWSPSSISRPAGLGIVVLLAACYIDGIYHPAKWFFAEGNVPSEFIERFCEPRQQRIGELELLAAVCAYLTFPYQLANRKIIHWIDNTGALAALIKGYASAADLAKIVHAFAVINLAIKCEPWFEYVRSKANIADLPSRGLFDYLLSLGAIKVDLLLPPPHWWDEPQAWFDGVCALAERHATTEPRSRNRARPDDAEGCRPRRRKYRAGLANRRPAENHFLPSVVIADSLDDRRLTCEADEITDVDISRAGPFGNPFNMGIFNNNESHRRESIALYQLWLNSRPSVCAEDLVLADGSMVAASLRPRGVYWRTRTGLDVQIAIQNLIRDHPDARAFRLRCSPSPADRLSHGGPLASEFRAIIGSDAA